MPIEQTLSRRFGQALTLFVVLLFIFLRYGLDSVQAARISDIRGTKHNLSATADGTAYTNPTAGAGNIPTRNIKASTETQLCVFCHTPHAATSGATPLWNRKVAGNGYTPNYVLYDSSTLDAKQVQGSLSQPGGSSKLCLSCHDGTVAIGNVNVLNGADTSGSAQTVSNITTTGGPYMPTGSSGASSGFTRNLGADLTNDHPISISYNDTLANRDGELRTPSTNTTIVGVRTTTSKPKLKLEPTGPAGANQAQVQCATCHDPHIRETNAATVGNQKFLRLNRFQHQDPPSSSGFNATDNSGDIICLACHDKGGASWAFSAHANSIVANETYSATHATRREFPANLPVWQAACLNCHDTHTVQGARRLLREGTNEGISTAGAAKSGGANTSALEETCYQCHDGGANGTLQAVTNVPNIKADFALATRMPITSSAQGTSGGAANSSEPHDINGNFSADAAFIDCSTAGAKCGKDFIEPRSKLGVGNLSNRHVECTDCHNPHRVIRAQNGLPGALNAANTQDTVAGRNTGGGAHKHTNANGYVHSNIISGVLRGSWGVEPTYGGASFHDLPTTYTVKRGDPGNSSSTAVTSTYVTREYQICLKCHSDYGYSDNNKHSSAGGNRPTVTLTGGTASGTNGLTMYTNQAKEFQAPAAHVGEPLNAGTDAGSADTNFNNNNHRSWHPVIAATGRSTAARGMSGGNPWVAPWNNTGAVGTQTMYCTDCHGSGVSTAKSVIPDGNNPWGPHGSNNNFILKGVWSKGMGATGRDSGETSNLLCFKCHDSANYTTRSDSGQKTGFYGGGKGNLHNYHVDKIGRLYCSWCHVAVPHGWKNKALLVNLNDVGEEAGLGVSTSKEVAINGNGGHYSKEPYYLAAKLKVSSFAQSGSWAAGNCGSRSKSGANLITSTDGASGGNTTGTGVNWMKSTCSGPTN